MTARERGRARLRVVTIAAGAASLAAAGVVAAILPGSAGSRTASAGTAPASQATQPRARAAGSWEGDDGGGDDGYRAQPASGGQPATAPRPATAPAHATSGGSQVAIP